MKLVCAGLAVLLAAAVLPLQADPAATAEQKNQVENCKILSGAVFEFAEARDKKQSKMAAFKNVTHGQNYVPGSLLDETLQWAYAHPDEQPDTTSAHFYGRCVLDAYDARNPDSEGELDIAATACQQGHAGVPDAIRECIVTKTQDIIANPPSAVAAATSVAPAVATVAAVAQAPSAATVVAVAAPPPAVTSPRPIAVIPPAVAATAPAASPTPAAAPRVVASAPETPVAVPAPAVAQPAPEPTPVLTPAAVSAAQPMVAQVQAPSAPPQEVTPPREPMSRTEVTFSAPAATVTGSVVAAASSPLAPPQPVVPPPAPVPVRPAPAPVIAQPVPAPVPVVAKATAPQPAATASQPAVAMAPVPSARARAAGEFPPNLTGYGKLTVGMPMEDAYKALGSHGDTDYDAQGEVHTYMIGDDHGFMELRASSAGTLYSIRVVGGADAHQPPVMTVVLGDAAFILINAVGLPSSRAPLPGDKELWNYRDRNYAWEISPGGDVIGLRIIDVNSTSNVTQ